VSSRRSAPYFSYFAADILAQDQQIVLLGKAVIQRRIQGLDQRHGLGAFGQVRIFPDLQAMFRRDFGDFLAGVSLFPGQLFHKPGRHLYRHRAEYFFARRQRRIFQLVDGGGHGLLRALLLLCFDGFGAESTVIEEGAHADQRIALQPFTLFVAGAVYRRSVIGRMRRVAVAQGLDQRRAAAGTRLVNGRPDGLIHSQHIHAVDPDAFEAIGFRLLRQRFSGCLFVQRRGLGIAIVLAEKHGGRLPHTGIIEAGVKIAFGSGAIAKDRDRDFAAAQHARSVAVAGRLGNVGADGRVERRDAVFVGIPDRVGHTPPQGQFIHLGYTTSQPDSLLAIGAEYPVAIFEDCGYCNVCFHAGAWVVSRNAAHALQLQGAFVKGSGTNHMAE
jgi:hypothetical protein